MLSKRIEWFIHLDDDTAPFASSRFYVWARETTEKEKNKNMWWKWLIHLPSLWLITYVSGMLRVHALLTDFVCLPLAGLSLRQMNKLKKKTPVNHHRASGISIHNKTYLFYRICLLWPRLFSVVHSNRNIMKWKYFCFSLHRSFGRLCLWTVSGKSWDYFSGEKRIYCFRQFTNLTIRDQQIDE